MPNVGHNPDPRYDKPGIWVYLFLIGLGLAWAWSFTALEPLEPKEVPHGQVQPR